MCRNIKPLFNFDPPVTQDEIHNASLQYVRKISGFQKPSEINAEAFSRAINDIQAATKQLLFALSTSAEPKNRDVEAAKAHERAIKRFG
jgi:hypothetical protein